VLRLSRQSQQFTAEQRSGEQRGTPTFEKKTR
jgi:hypothetical protein